MSSANPVPPALTLARNCEGWGTLPDAGGYLDQDYSTMISMNVAMNVYKVVSKARNAQGKAIHSLTHDERLMLKSLIDRGLV